MKIERYQPLVHENSLMAMIEREGEEWITYWGENNALYRETVKRSITYVALEEGQVIGYSRSLEDYGFYIYVCDLLVDKEHRGHGIGKRLMDAIKKDYPTYTVYVMSDVDGYYKKLGYRIEGTVFEVL